MAPTLPGGAVREWQCYQPQFEPGGMRALQTPEPTGGFRVSVPFRQREPIDGTLMRVLGTEKAVWLRPSVARPLPTACPTGR
jgi:hypothetical protein